MTTLERKVYAYTYERSFTEDEYDELMAEFKAALARNDTETSSRLIKKIPMDPDVLMAFGTVYGKEFIIETGYDLAQADKKFGKGWLDEL